MGSYPQEYSVPPVQAIASYSYTDIASGTGFIVYNGYNSIDEATKKTSLTSQNIYSETIYTSGTYTETAPAWQKCLDIDFDLTEFKIAQTVSGKAIVMFTWGAKGVGGAAINTYCVAKIRKWDGSTETEIGDAQKGNSSNVYTSPAAGNWNTWSGTVEIDLTETHFKVGDILRLTIELWGQGGNGSVNDVLIAHSPQNLTESSVLDPGADANQLSKYTFLKVHVPFKLDL